MTSFTFPIPQKGLPDTLKVHVNGCGLGLGLGGGCRGGRFEAQHLLTFVYERVFEEPKEEESEKEEGLICEKEYWEDTGKLALEYCTLNGQFQGEYKKCHPNGEPWEVTNYDHGVRDGWQRIFNANGNKTIETHWVNGKKDGWQIYYYPESGQIKSRRHFANNVLHGTETFYCDDEEHTVEKEIEWQNGEKISEEIHGYCHGGTQFIEY